MLPVNAGSDSQCKRSDQPKIYKIANNDILDFSYCPLSRVLHVTLANWQEFRFEFHLRSSPSYSEYMDISLPAEYFIAILHSLLHRTDETQQGRNSCLRLQLLAFSLNSIMSLRR